MWTTRAGRRAALVLLTGADAGALVLLRPHLTLLRAITRPHRWVATVGPDTAAAHLAGAALWLVALWLGVGLGACAVSALPGAVGRSAGRIARGTLPRAVYRLAAGAVGVGVVLAPLSLGVGHAAAAQPARPVASSTPAPDWPTDDAVPAPHWPTSAHPTSAHPTAHTPRPHPRAADRAASSVVVAAGDSLWRIAAAQLPEPNPSARRIAAAWPRWYSANRAVIGADPNHLVPGQVLTVPAPSPQQSPAQEDPS